MARLHLPLRPQGPHRSPRTSLDALETEPLSAELFTIGEVGVACLLGYLEFRWPERDWRTGRPSLVAWWAATAARPSLVKTAHRLPAIDPRP
ncbi:glutathione S-transferase C-terminal domain-containing protein [Sorangium sp. So ce1097]|uniref:glutathione S-transferase C-terminal domain-containing protein n=1 Tax=Sorangium sp. So ce1097 TaxID=3133330 RepID=UPI003F6342E9